MSVQTVTAGAANPVLAQPQVQPQQDQAQLLEEPAQEPTVVEAAPVADRGRRWLWIAAVAVVALLAIGALIYFIRRSRAATKPPAAGERYTPLTAAQILPSGKYRIRWDDKGWLAVWEAGALYGSAMLDPNLTLTTAPEWTYDATTRTLSVYNARLKTQVNAIYWPGAPTSVVYLLPPEYLDRTQGATLAGWVIGGPATSSGTNPTATGTIANVVGQTNVAYKGLTTNNVYGLPEVLKQSPVANLPGSTNQWAFYPAAS